MTKALVLFLLLVPAVHAQQGGKAPLTFYQACFGGVDNYRDSARIDDCDFQDGRNFLTDRGYLEKRPGSLRRIDKVNAGFPVQYGAEFITQSNVKTLVLHSGTTIYATDFSAAPVAITTVNVNATVDSVSAYNKHFFVTGYDTPFYYDGTSAVAVSSIPSGNFIEFANERLWVANVTGAESTLYTSAFGDYTDWTIPDPLPADAPNSFTFDRQDGKPLTGIHWSPYGMMVFKRTKTFILYGVDNDDFEKRRISDSVGCVDDRSIRIVDGLVTWLGEDGVYQWGGGATAPALISRDIDTTIKAVRNITSNPDSQSISSLADFQAGTSAINGDMPGWSTAISPGSIVPSTWTSTDTSGEDFGAGTLSNITTTYLNGSILLDVSLSSSVYDNFTDGNYTSNPTWTVSGSNYFNASTGELVYNTGATGTYTGFIWSSTNTLVFGNWSIHVETSQGPLLAGDPANLSSIEYFVIANSTTIAILSGLSIKASCVDYPTHCKFQMYKYASGSATLLDEISVGAKFLDGTIDISILASGAIAATFTDIYSVKYNLTGVLSDTSTQNTAQIIRVWQYVGNSLTSKLSIIDNIARPLGFDLAGTFTSQIFDTTFSTPTGGPFSFSETVPVGSTIAYAVRESSTSVASTWSDWTTVSTTTSGAYRIPLTKQYWQYKADFSTDNSTQTPSIQDVTLTAASTGTWDSAVLSIGTDITSWGQFAANTDSTESSTLIFYTRASSSTFSQSSETPAWTLQGNGENVACSTGAFAQVRVVSAVGSSTDTAKVNSITLNWQEGEAGKVASLFYDKRYFLSVATSTSTAVNNLTLVRQRTGKWTIFEGPYWGSLWLYDLKPYAGDGLTTSKVWRIMYEDAWYDDNSTAIDAYVVTKDFQFGGQNHMKVFRQLYLEASSTEDTTLSLGRAVDKLSAYTTTTQTITGGTIFNDEIKGMFPGFTRGRYIRFRFGNAILNEPLKLDGYTVLGDIEGLYRR